MTESDVEKATIMIFNQDHNYPTVEKPYPLVTHFETAAQWPHAQWYCSDLVQIQKDTFQTVKFPYSQWLDLPQILSISV